MTNTIVVGFQATPSGLEALGLGRRLAESTAATLLVANVYKNDVNASPELSNRSSAELEAAKPTLDGFQRWEPWALGAMAPAQGLLELARDRKARMIVVGATHRHGPATFGATALEVLENAPPCPVAVTPADGTTAKAGPVQDIGAAYDGSPESQRALEAAAELAADSGASLHLFEAFDRPPPDELFLMAATRKGYSGTVADMRADATTVLDAAAGRLDPAIPTTAQVVDGETVQALADASAAMDLLAVGPRAPAVMPGSVTARLLSHAHCPLLVVPRP
jgi:nucleotide-binding universal stress UspA family protein